MRNTILAAAMCVAALPAQSWRTEEVESVGIKFKAVGRLERLPMRLGPGGNPYHRARLRPKDIGDYVNGSYLWFCDVYEFRKKDDANEEELDLSGLTEEEAEFRKRIRELMSRGKHIGSFEDWLKGEEDANVTQKGRQRRGSLPFKHWKWIRKGRYQPRGLMYAEAAVYSFEDREVALVIEVPITKSNGKRPSSKWLNYIKRMIRSGRLLKEDDDDDVNEKRDQYADTASKQAALDEAKANIAGLRGWDYFTTPNYIVLYSWDFEKPAERSQSRRDARYYSDRLEKMRELYIEEYELDETGVLPVLPDPSSIQGLGPTTGSEKQDLAKEMKERVDRVKSKSTEEGIDMPYPVFRLCATYDQFMKYGNSPPGVVGWFSPASKELVVFLGGDKMMGKGATETVTYHEGWHQFADLYFNGPATVGGRLHRWFDEGHGDYFGSFRWARGKWVYEGSKMRHDDVKNMVRVGDYQPFDKIVTWHTRRFYGPRAPYYYAQAYSMIDFLRRGSKLKRHWNERWATVLDTYRKVMLVYGDDEKAVDLAFYGFEDQDWRELEEAWKEWVESRYFEDGR